MAFTYLPTLATDRDQIRFDLGDTTVAPSGIMPNGDNVPDETIAALLTKYEDNADKVFIALCKAVGAAWAHSPTEHAADGLTVKRGDVGKRWRDMATQRETDTGLGAGYVGYLHEQEADAEVATWPVS